MTPGKIPVGYSITQKRAAKGFKKEKAPRFGRIPPRKVALYPLLLRYAFSDRSIVMVTEGLAPQPFHGRIGLLVNQHTASAAETITGFAKENSWPPLSEPRQLAMSWAEQVSRWGTGSFCAFPW